MKTEHDCETDVIRGSLGFLLAALQLAAGEHVALRSMPNGDALWPSPIGLRTG